jgi:hypothetical protein
MFIGELLVLFIATIFIHYYFDYYRTCDHLSVTTITGHYEKHPISNILAQTQNRMLAIWFTTVYSHGESNFLEFIII